MTAATAPGATRGRAREGASRSEVLKKLRIYCRDAINGSLVPFTLLHSLTEHAIWLLVAF